MKLLENIFLAEKNLDSELFTSYLKQIIATYIEEFSTSSTFMESISPFCKFYSISNRRSENENHLAKNLISENSKTQLANLCEEKDYKIDLKEVKKLSDVFTKTGSQKIKQLLMFLENTNSSIRKLGLILFQIILKRNKSKMYFIEKCALGFSNGLYLLTRMKWLSKISNNDGKIFMLLIKIRKYINEIKMKVLVKSKSFDGNIFK